VSRQAVTHADYRDPNALDRFARDVDVITYEFENVDVTSVELLSKIKPVRPGARALKVAQDRLVEKEFVERLGGRTAPYRPVDTIDGLSAAIADLGFPSILKTRRFGYDGKGQVRIGNAVEFGGAWAAIAGRSSILEGLVRFDAEFSIILARGKDGSIVVYDAPRNEHDNGILARSHVPAGAIVQEQVGRAEALARTAADSLGYIGVLTFEFFATALGPVFNEMAPRVHNSGHWTIEGARTSQFENHIRAICELPLGDPSLATERVTMANLIGDAALDATNVLADPNAHLHLYGKAEVKEGRKMGHVTWI
jgi:5-(carboxyamino)imidazole ribonucleotide synthase